MSATVGRAGVVLGNADPGTPEWFELRRGGITATDLPKVLGLSKYGNALSVWHDKRGTLPAEPAGEAARWGQLLEDVVAREWAERRGVRLRRVGVAANVTFTWQRASLDRVIVGTKEALEVKTRSAYTAGSWASDIPDDVLAQVAWQRRILHLDAVHVAVLIGGQELRSFTYERDETLEAYLLEQAETVWRHVEDGTPPMGLVAIDGVLANLLDMLHPDRAGITDVDPEQGQALVDAYRAAAAAEKAAAKAGILLALGDGDVLTADGQRLATYAETNRMALSLPALRKARPELVDELDAAGLITTTTSRTLRVQTGDPS